MVILPASPITALSIAPEKMAAQPVRLTDTPLPTHASMRILPPERCVSTAHACAKLVIWCIPVSIICALPAVQRPEMVLSGLLAPRLYLQPGMYRSSHGMYR